MATSHRQHLQRWPLHRLLPQPVLVHPAAVKVVEVRMDRLVRRATPRSTAWRGASISGMRRRSRRR
jgi:hypothetical protein